MRKFNNSFPGYNKNEVNSFVKNVTTEYESMLNNLKMRDQEIQALKKELEHFKNIESTLNRAILIAEESSQTIKKTAFEESKVIIEDAKRNSMVQTVNGIIDAAEYYYANQMINGGKLKENVILIMKERMCLCF